MRTDFLNIYEKLRGKWIYPHVCFVNERIKIINEIILEKKSQRKIQQVL
jgi:hypothetical protein